MSDYLDEMLDPASRRQIGRHLASCSECRRLEEDMRGVLRWGRDFPEHAPPEWLLSRILARTPRVQKETWSDTLAALAGWIGPRRAAAACVSLLCLVWVASAVELSPAGFEFQSPRAIYYRLDRAAGRVYGQAIRLYQRAPIVTEIQARIDQIRENSG